MTKGILYRVEFNCSVLNVNAPYSSLSPLCERHCPKYNMARFGDEYNIPLGEIIEHDPIEDIMKAIENLPEDMHPVEFASYIGNIDLPDIIVSYFKDGNLIITKKNREPEEEILCYLEVYAIGEDRREIINSIKKEVHKPFSKEEFMELAMEIKLGKVFWKTKMDFLQHMGELVVGTKEVKPPPDFNKINYDLVKEIENKITDPVYTLMEKEVEIDFSKESMKDKLRELRGISKKDE